MKYKTTILLISLFLLTSLKIKAQWEEKGKRLSFTSDDHHKPVMSATLDGGAYICWVASNPGTYNTYGNIILIALDASGNTYPGWPEGGITVMQGKTYWAPEIITSEDDAVIIACQGYTEDDDLLHIYAQKYSKQGIPLWNKGKPVLVAPSQKNNDQYPQIVSDKHKGFFVSFNRFDSLMNMGSTDIHLQHIDSTGKPASNWNNKGTIVVNSDVRESYSRIAFSDDGKAVYVSYMRGEIGKAKLYLKKFNASDGKQDKDWLDNGIIISPGPVYFNVKNDNFLFCDKKNNAIIIWNEPRYTVNGETFFQQVSPLGLPQLSGSGLCIAGKEYESGTGYLEAVRNEEGNFIIAYNNYHNNYNINALKIAPNGNIIWKNLDVTTDGKSAHPKPVSNGKKGAYLFYKNTSMNTLHAIALDSTGKNYETWNDLPDYGGIQKYDMFHHDYDFTAKATINGKAIITWNRKDLDNYNVYACNLLADGTNCVWDPTAVKEQYNYNNINIYPNPFSDKINISNTKKYNIIYFNLYDITGKQILTCKLTKELNYSINTAALQKGMYFYTLNSENQTLKKSILIKQ